MVKQAILGTVEAKVTKEPVFVYGANPVVLPLIETTLASYIVPPNKTFYVKSIVVGGNAIGVFYLKQNDAIICAIRNSMAAPTIFAKPFDDGEVYFNAGSVIKITVIQNGINPWSYEGTLVGYNV